MTFSPRHPGGGGQDVPVARIGKVKRLDQGLIARHQAIAHCPVYELAEASCLLLRDVRAVLLQCPKRLVEDLVHFACTR